MVDTNRSQENTEPSKMSEAKSIEIQCPYCGSKNPVYGAFCPDCGKRIKDVNPSGDEKTLGSYQPPPIMNVKSGFPHTPKSHRSRNLIIALMIGIIAVSLVFGALSFSSLKNNSGQSSQDLGSSTSTPSLAPPSTQPTLAPTPSPTLAPTATPAPTPTQSIEITGINLQVQYGGSDQGYFGAVSQSIAISNQPNQILTVNQGTQFFLYFTLTESSTATRGDSINSVTVGTAGFTTVSVEPQVPIAFSPGSSTQITVTLMAPQSSFNGPIQIVVSTSGGTPTSTQAPQ